MRGAASRLRHLARHFRSRRLSEEEGETLGYLPRRHMPGCSTIHPVTGDQLVRRCHGAESHAADFLHSCRWIFFNCAARNSTIVPLNLLYLCR
jgi:hypothetical protein